MENTTIVSTAADTVIDAQVEIIGKIKSNGPIQIDGRLDGDLECTGDVTIGKTAQIKGNLYANTISVAGTVSGNISAKDRIEMKSSAKITGDVKSKRLTVEDGVTFIGKSEVNPSGVAGNVSRSEEKQSQPAPKETAVRQEEFSRVVYRK